MENGKIENSYLRPRPRALVPSCPRAVVPSCRRAVELSCRRKVQPESIKFIYPPLISTFSSTFTAKIYVWFPVFS